MINQFRTSLGYQNCNYKELYACLQGTYTCGDLLLESLIDYAEASSNQVELYEFAHKHGIFRYSSKFY